MNTEPDGLSKATAADPLIDQAVVDLHIARRTLLIYPASHGQVKRSLSRVFKSLSAALVKQGNITLAVLKDGIACNDQALGANAAVLADLASVLKHYRIAVLTFSNGLESSELVKFLRLISVDRKKIMAGGGVAVIAEKNQLRHVKIQTVDYSKLQMTEESEIQRSSRRDSDGAVWQSFVANLLTDGNQDDRGGNTAAINLDPNELADMLNRRILNPGAAIAQYEKLVADTSGGDSGPAPISEGLLQFQEMIKELNPELQEQFLSLTFDHWAQTENVSNTAHLIDGLGAELILQMLRQANSSGKKISPSLVAFISKVGHLNAPEEGLPALGQEATDTARGLSTKKIESLLSREQFDTYVDSGYSQLLNDLTARERESGMDSQADNFREQLATGIGDAAICAHTVRAMTRLMAGSPDVAGYRDWARQLAYLLDDLLKTQAYDGLLELMSFAHTEQNCEDKARSEIAGLLLGRFSDPQFVSKAIETVQKSGPDLSPQALRFLMELGEPVVLEILDEIDPSHTLHGEGVVTQILKNLSSLSAREAAQRLKDPRPDYVCRMLRIIRRLGDSESAQHVRTLLDHTYSEVRMEALATLLKFENNWGLIRLRDIMEKPMNADFYPALDLAGKYRVRAVVPQLIALFEQRGDLDLREAALRALGRIGDPRAIPALTKLVGRRWSIAKKHINHLKSVLFETLEGYPHGEIKHLLHIGLKEKDVDIQSVCRKILRNRAQVSGSAGQSVRNRVKS